MTDVLDTYDATDGGLAFWHPVEDDEITETYLQWGQVAPGSSADIRVRVHNDSDGYTADDITVTIAGPVDAGDPDAAAQHLVSVDGQTFATAVVIGDLPPNATSEPVWLRRITPPEAAGEGMFRLSATATTWTPATGGGDLGTAPGPAYDPATAGDPVGDQQDQM